jgi:hypothetical protein
MQILRPFMVKYGEALIVAEFVGEVVSWFTTTWFPIFPASCVAAADGFSTLHIVGRRHCRH